MAEITDRGKAVMESGLTVRQAHEILRPEFEMPEPTRLMIAGDWHGDTIWAEMIIDRAAANSVDVILQLGDFGYWPAWDEVTQSQTGGSRFTSHIHDYAKAKGVPVYWIDGNHENHEALYPDQGDEWLRHLSRGHRWQWWGKTWMAVGGGVSVDKDWRTPGYDWFPQETLTAEQVEYCCREGGVDVIVSHDAPDGVQIPGLHGEMKTKNVGGYFPQAAINASNEHRALLGMIVEDTHPTHLFHGHYHERHNAQRSYANSAQSCAIIGLDRNRAKAKELNYVIITKDDLT